jgi:amino acid adenylation domain-containing protein
MSSQRSEALSARHEESPATSASASRIVSGTRADGGSVSFFFVLRLAAPVDAGALGRAVDEAFRRHLDAAGHAAAPAEGLLRTEFVPCADWPHTDDMLRDLAAVHAALLPGARNQPGRAILLDGGANSALVLVVGADAAAGADRLPREVEMLYDAFSRGGAAPRARPAAAAPSCWERRLSGAPPLLELPTDRPRPAAPTGETGAVPLRLSAEAVTAMRARAASCGTTLATALNAAFGLLMHRWSGAREMVIGTSEGAAWLPLRVDLSGDPDFGVLLERVQGASGSTLCLGCDSFGALLEALKVERTPAYAPLFQAGVAVGATDQAPAGIEGAPLDLVFALCPDGEGMRGTARFRADLFDAATVARMAEHLELLVRGAAANPELPGTAHGLLPAPERETIVGVWGSTAVDFGPDTTLSRALEAQVARTPDAPAVTFEGETITRRELNARANRLAHRLRAMGVGPEVAVAVVMERSFEMVVALYGVLKAGGLYVPVDPANPAERVAYMLADSAATVVLTQARLADTLPESHATVVELDATDLSGESDANPEGGAEPGNLAYIIYTSGSTGRPKGAMNEHRGVMNRLRWFQSHYGLGPSDVVVQKTPFSFDVSVWELFGAPLAGARLVVAAPGAHREPAAMAELVRREGITAIHFVPSMLGVFLEHPAARECPTIRRVFCSGEALTAELQERCFAVLGGVQLLNLYGPTEAAVEVTHWPCVPGTVRAHVPIGFPVANTRMHVLDGRGAMVPVGIPGELHIGGVQVARGYWNRPALTASVFVPDPFGGPGARMYRTGDRARWRTDGAIEYLGRLDFQVKIRGLRIETGEIEAALLRHPGVRDVVVLARPDAAGETALVAYAVPGPDAPAAAELRTHLRAGLPAYMVPAAFVFLDAFPLTGSGKVDRRALPAPDASAFGAGEAFTAPRTPTEDVLAAIVAQVLRRPRVSADEDFFGMGGNSLSAIRVTGRVQEVLGVALPLRVFFDTPTVQGVAAAVDRLVSRVDGEFDALPPVTAVEHDAEPPLSCWQEQLWFVDQMQPGNYYNVPCVLRLSGPLDVDALSRALDEVVRRHDAYRTVIQPRGDGWVQRILPPFSLDLVPVDLSALPEAEREAEARRRASDEANRRFDMTHGPLVRAALLRLAGDEHVLALVAHHIVTDGWSIVVTWREVSALYAAFTRGEASPLAELPVQYADYAVWQRRNLQGPRVRAQAEWWRAQLAGAPALLELPSDRPRAAAPSFRGGLVPVTIPRETVEPLRAVARREGATLYMVLLAGWSALLSKYSGQTDVVVGAPIAGRPQPELERMAGLFVNVLAVRTELADDPAFAALVRRVRETTLGAYARQDLTFEQLVEAVQPVRTLAHSPIFQVVFSYEDAPWEGLSLPGIAVRGARHAPDFAKLDLELSLYESDGGVQGTLCYASDLFDEATAVRFGTQFAALLRAAAHAPETPVSRLSPLMEDERRALLASWTPAPRAYPPSTVHALFAEQARATPHARAVGTAAGGYTYAALEARANRLAWHLRAAGVGAETRVGVSLERSPELAVALLAILKAGGAYVPLDPAYPAERLAFMLRDAGVSVVVTDTALAAALPLDGVPAVRLDAEADVIALRPGGAPADVCAPDSLAYVVYTSGSTGTPKGVAVPHRAVVRLVRGADFAELGADEVFLQLAPVAFDASTLEVWGALLNGGRLAPFPGAMPSLEELGAFIREEGVTTLWLTAGLFHRMVDARLADLAGVRQLLAGGDVLSPPQVARALAGLPGVRLINGYGPTENTTFTCCHTIRPGDAGRASIPLGRAIAGTRAYVLDAALAPAAEGVPGELFAAGDGLARGYLGRAALTAGRFVPDPFGEPGGRMYRTGDRVRRLPDGTLEFLGRLDQQVKVRGFRIETGEIEAALAAHPAVRAAAVTVHADATGERSLVAYVAADGETAAAELRAHLRARLPDYMVPASFVSLAELPLTPNGKVDRRALAAPRAAAAPAAEYVAPRTETEKALAGIWAEVLGVPRVGVNDDFFGTGGHSLRAMQAASRTRDVLQVSVSVRAFFEHPTLGALAAEVERLLVAQGTMSVAGLAPIARHARRTMTDRKPTGAL